MPFREQGQEIARIRMYNSLAENSQPFMHEEMFLSV